MMKWVKRNYTFSWYGHVKRISEERRYIKIVYLVASYSLGRERDTISEGKTGKRREDVNRGCSDRATRSLFCHDHPLRWKLYQEARQNRLDQSDNMGKKKNSAFALL